MLRIEILCNHLRLILLLALFAIPSLPAALSAQTAHSNVAAVNFGIIPIGAKSPAKSVVFTFDSGGNLGSLPGVFTQGAPDLDFTDAGTGTCTTNSTTHVYSKGDSCTVDVIFSPPSRHWSYGAAVLTSAAGETIAVAPLLGSGTGPEAIFIPGTQQSPESGFLLPSLIALDGNHNLFVYNSDENPSPSITEVSQDRTVKKLISGYSVTQMAVDGAGSLYFSGTSPASQNGIFELQAVNGVIPGSPAPKLVIAPPSGGAGFESVVIDGHGNLYSMLSNGTLEDIEAVHGIIPASPIIRTLGSGYRGTATAIDGNNNIWIANGNGTITQVEAVNGVIPASPTTRTLSTGGKSSSGVAVDGSGNVYVADSGAPAKIYELEAVNGVIPASPIITTLGSVSTDAPSVTVDNLGNVYFPDQGIDDVFEVNRVSSPTILFASTVAGSTASNTPQVVTVQNAGSTPLKFSSVTYPADFPESSASIPTDCTSSTSLAAGKFCTFTISFKPGPLSGSATSAHLTESVTFTTNTLNTPATAQSIPVTGTAVKIASSISLKSSDTLAIVGEPITFTANLSGMSHIPTGAVNFYSGTSLLGSATLNSGVATYPTASLPLGSNIVTAVYSGDGTYTTATSTALTELIANSGAILLSSAAPQTLIDSPVTLIATVAAPVAGPVPTGSFKFYEITPTGDPSLGIIPLANGTATLSITTLLRGKHTFIARYFGDSHYTGGVSSTIDVTVNRISTAVALEVSPNPAPIGDQVTITAIVAAKLPGVTPTGTVNFYIDSKRLGLFPITNGAAVYQTSSLAAGPHTVVAQFNGDPNYTGVDSDVRVLTVGHVPTTLSLTGPTGASGCPCILKYTATAAETIAGRVPTGSVSFYINNSLIKTVPMTAGQATFSPTLAAEVYYMYSTYTGDSNYQSATSPNLTITNPK